MLVLQALEVASVLVLGLRREKNYVMVHKRWYHLWRVGKFVTLPARLMAWAHAELSVEEDDLLYIARLRQCRPYVQPGYNSSLRSDFIMKRVSPPEAA